MPVRDRSPASRLFLVLAVAGLAAAAVAPPLAAAGGVADHRHGRLPAVAAAVLPLVPGAAAGAARPRRRRRGRRDRPRDRARPRIASPAASVSRDRYAPHASRRWSARSLVLATAAPMALTAWRQRSGVSERGRACLHRRRCVAGARDAAGRHGRLPRGRLPRLPLAPAHRRSARPRVARRGRGDRASRLPSHLPHAPARRHPPPAVVLPGVHGHPGRPALVPRASTRAVATLPSGRSEPITVYRRIAPGPPHD